MLLFAQGYAGLFKRSKVKSSTPNPVIPDDNGKGPKNYQKKLLEAFNIFCPLGKEPMRYSDMLEKDARIIYRTSPHKKYFHRFDARLTISEEEFYSNPKKAFMTALSMEEKEIALMWYSSSSHQIGCYVRLKKKKHLLHILCMFD
ncbi:hypothetical protein GCK32_011593 [Trichostrongylus colubriformis]|uniref:Uncharacterized protein n=1 Tax=Trichostrongylus colubriformis TaxID=6319 RepID=A0AAN8F9X4_TRICO